jgi:hypothetical protein
MATSSIVPSNETNQKHLIDAQWKYEVERFYNGLVYCPMCEELHENNTNCQRND